MPIETNIALLGYGTVGAAVDELLSLTRLAGPPDDYWTSRSRRPWG